MKTETKGILYITFSALFFGSYGIWAKLMATSFGNFSQAWIRSLLILAIIIPIGIVRKDFKKIQKKDYIWFFLISLVSFSAAPYFYAFHTMPIGTATLFFYTSLVITGYIFGVIFFKEVLSHIKVISLILAFVGMFLIFRFSLTGASILGAIGTIFAGSLGAFDTSLTKKVSREYTSNQILVYIFGATALVNFIISVLIKDPVPTSLFSIGSFAEIAYTIAMLLAMLFVIEGFKHTEAIIGSLLGLSEILFAIIFGILIFKQSFDIFSLLGTLLILISIAFPQLFTMIQKYVSIYKINHNQI